MVQQFSTARPPAGAAQAVRAKSESPQAPQMRGFGGIRTGHMDLFCRYGLVIPSRLLSTSKRERETRHVSTSQVIFWTLIAVCLSHCPFRPRRLRSIYWGHPQEGEICGGAASFRPSTALLERQARDWDQALKAAEVERRGWSGSSGRASARHTCRDLRFPLSPEVVQSVK